MKQLKNLDYIMNKSLYFVECTCIKNCLYPNVEFHIGEVLYYNKKAASNEMYLFNPYINPGSEFMNENHAKKYFGLCGNSLYLPFTRKKNNAKKWEIKRYAEQIAECINNRHEFNAIVKEIKVIYEEEEV